MKHKIAMPTSVKAFFKGNDAPMNKQAIDEKVTSTFANMLFNLALKDLDAQAEHPMPTKRIIETKILTFRDAFIGVEEIEEEISKHRNEGYVVVFEHIDIANRGYFLRLERASDVDVCQRCLVEHKDLNEDLLCPLCQDVKDMGEKIWDDLEAVNADNPVNAPEIKPAPVAVPMPVGYDKGIEIDPLKVTITVGEGAPVGTGGAGQLLKVINNTSSGVITVNPNLPVLELVNTHGAEAVISSVHTHLEEIGKKAFADSMQKTEGLSGQELLEEVLNVQFS